MRPGGRVALWLVHTCVTCSAGTQVKQLLPALAGCVARVDATSRTNILRVMAAVCDVEGGVQVCNCPAPCRLGWRPHNRTRIVRLQAVVNSEWTIRLMDVVCGDRSKPADV